MPACLLPVALLAVPSLFAPNEPPHLGVVVEGAVGYPELTGGAWMNLGRIGAGLMVGAVEESAGGGPGSMWAGGLEWTAILDKNQGAGIAARFTLGRRDSHEYTCFLERYGANDNCEGFDAWRWSVELALRVEGRWLGVDAFVGTLVTHWEAPEDALPEELPPQTMAVAGVRLRFHVF